MLPRDEILSFASPGLSFHDNEQLLCVKHAEVLRESLKVKALQWVSGRSQEPVLEIFLSDGTPHTTLQRKTVAGYDVCVRRAGKSCGDYLTQRLFLHDVRGDTCVLFEYPAYTAGDKTVDVSFGGWLRLWDGARRLGAEDFVVSHFCFDGGVKSAFERRMRQHFAASDFNIAPKILLKPAELYSCHGRLASHAALIASTMRSSGAFPAGQTTARPCGTHGSSRRRCGTRQTFERLGCKAHLVRRLDRWRIAGYLRVARHRQ